MRVLVCGDREWKDFVFMERILSRFWLHASVIIHGDARGADKMAANWAKSRGIRPEPYPADWDRYHRAAGPIRNRQMLKEGKPDVVVAFHDDIEKSKGTRDMINVAAEAGIQVFLYTHRDTDYGDDHGVRGLSFVPDELEREEEVLPSDGDHDT